MRPLNKMLFRDLWHLRGQVAATSLVVACGVASFVTMRSTYNSLRASQEAYYSAYRFGEVFAGLKRAPESVRRQIENIPGVAAVQTRVVSEVSLDLPGVEEPAQGRLVSIPPQREPMLNDLHLVRGQYIDREKPDEVIVSEAFAEANRFQPGDRIEANINGRLRKLTIAGVALSPEYIYEIRPGDIFPDNRRFGVIWINREEAAAAFQMVGAFNDVSLTLAPGASKDAVIEDLDRILEPYGGRGAYGREDQQSYRFISNEFSELRTFGMFLPVVFLGVTAFLVHLVMSRLVRTQREQIGLLKAFGYSTASVGVHYLLLAVCAVAAGAVAGIFLGIWLGSGMTGLYAEYFHFPVLEYGAGWMVVAAAFLISFASASFGAAAAVMRAVALPPAEEMRPEAPADYSPGLLERLELQRWISPVNRIVLRNLVRQPVKASLATLGISLAAALLFTGFYFFDAIDRIIEIEFGEVSREDAVVSFYTARPGRARFEIANLPGITGAEFFRAVPVRLRNGNYRKLAVLLGTEAGAELHRIVDEDGVVHQPPADGLMLSDALAEELRVGPGDTLTIEVLEGDRQIRQLEVVVTVAELMGMNAYMEIGALNRLLNEDDVISGAYLSTAERADPGLYQTLKRMPAVAGVGLPAVILQGFNDTFARTIGIFTFVLVLFSGAIVLGVTYNAARIALSERGREFASLRVLGFTRGEIARMLFGEQAILTALAIPLGFAIGIVLCYSVNNLVDREILRMPMVFSRQTFLLTGLIVAAASVVSSLIVGRRIGRLDLVEVLKTRE